MEETKTCDCKLCTRSRDFKKYIASISNEETKKFMEELYGALWEAEEEAEELRIYQRNLNETYPSIYIECRTIGRIAPGTENHPEINI